ncbi:type 4a pilus biogenesis protein PilO [Bacillus sp. FJAT-45350]|uniref:type 4a pilus biogenesis protein PilO n=1 Tax=Bacillus sp. FJAT-45350 TaxID=2011014 RepID=UPI000BB7C802|nr:type 4a pilus biogenesis protein PilO [Bacillus sp. FJAT-45350]
MNLSFSKKHIIILGVAIFLLIASAFFFFSQYISPAMKEKEVLAAEVEFEKSQLAILRDQQRDTTTEAIETSIELQRKLPVKPLVDQFLLDISRAEGLSNSYILYIDISEGGELSLRATEDGVEGETSTPVEQSEGEGGQETTQEQQVNVDIEGLKQITLNLSVRANRYQDLAQFLRELDRLPRISSIDSVSFIGHDEQIMVDDVHDSLEFNVTVSTYFYPELLELGEEGPKVDYPRPSNKDNPLYSN